MKRGERYTLLHRVLGLATSSRLSFKLKKEKEKNKLRIVFSQQVISHYALIYEIKAGTCMPKKYLGHAKLNFHLTYFSKKKKKSSKMGFHYTEMLATFFFFFFLRKNLSTFINVNELHPNVKPKQYVEVHLPSILDNLVCL